MPDPNLHVLTLALGTALLPHLSPEGINHSVGSSGKTRYEPAAQEESSLVVSST